MQIQTVLVNTLVTLDGTGSFDPDGSIQSYFWTQITGATVVLSGSTTATPTWTASSGGTRSFRLTIIDNSGQSSSDTVSIAVLPPVSAVTLISDPGSPQLVGSQVKFTAGASGGSGAYEYYFRYRDPAQTWHDGQVYSTNGQWTWDTVSLPTGTYTIQVQARNYGSVASYEAYQEISYLLVFSQYTILTSFNSGGSVSPAFALISFGSTTSFTVLSDPGYYIQSVSGCSGTLTGIVFTTGPVYSDCTIAVAFTLLPSMTSNPSFVSAPNRTDMVYDQKRGMLYIASGDRVLRYDMVEQTFATPWVLGGDLKGIDISKDNNTLAVGDLTNASSQVWIHIINIDTGTSNKISTSQEIAEAGTYAVAFGSDDAIYASSEGGPLRKIDPNTGAVSTLLTAQNKTMVSASADGRFIGFAESYSRFGRYDVSIENLIHQTDSLGTGWSNYEIAINNDGTQYAVPTYGGTIIYDQNLAKVVTLDSTAAGYADGVSYNPITSALYLSLADKSIVRAYDTTSFVRLADYDFGKIFQWNGNGNFSDGRLRIAKDGSILYASVPGGVECLDLVRAPRSTKITVSSTLSGPLVGQPVTLTAKIAKTLVDNVNTPTGMITFLDGQMTLGSATLTGTPPSASITTSWLSAGAHSIKAMYSGDSNYDAAKSDALIQNIKIQLTVSKSGAGAGTISTSAGQIAWTGNAGIIPLDLNSSITLSAVANTGSTWINWSGCDTVSANQCMVTMGAARNVVATFIHLGAPIVQGVSPTTIVTPIWQWTSGGGGNGIYRYKLDNSIMSYGTVTTLINSFMPSQPLVEGAHTLFVQEQDNSEYWSTIGSNTIIIDLTPPALFSEATYVDASHVSVQFNEPVTGAITPTNYTANNGLSITGVTNQGNNKYLLTTSHQMLGTDYTVLANTTNIADLAGNRLDKGAATAYFRRNSEANSAPSTPLLWWPAMSIPLTSLTPTLIIETSSDPDGDQVFYTYEVYADAGLTSLVAAATVTTTSWVAVPTLQDNSAYYWRVMASDGSKNSVWMSTANFRTDISFNTSPQTQLTMQSDAGDYIGAGKNAFYALADGVFSAQLANDNAISITFHTPGYSHWWYLNFAAPNGVPLTVGVYEGATRYPFEASNVPGLSVYGDGRGCNTLTGSFEVKEIHYGANNVIESFWASFEQHCEGGVPALRGDISFNANLSYTASASAGFGGSISPSSAIVTYGSITQFTITPDAGYHIDQVSGCNGNLLGNTYITASITSNCTITAIFAHDAVNGSCGLASSGTFTTAPVANLCTAGNASAVTGSGPWNWTCIGLFSGSTATCHADMQTYSVIFKSGGNGGLTGAPNQIVNHGSSATPVTAMPDLGYHFLNWTGTSSFVTTTANPLTVTNVTSGMTITASFAHNTVNGSCGNANNGAFTSAPSTDLCSAGIASFVTGSGPWNWTCDGLYNGISVSCLANIQTFTLTIKKTGSGTVIPDKGVIVWSGTTGTAVFNYNTAVILTAATSTRGEFIDWGHDCADTSGTCSIVMDGNKSVNAQFTHSFYSVSKIDVGLSNTTVISSDGTLWAWGNNTYGKLGNGTTEQSTFPVQIAPDSTFLDVTNGCGHTLAIRSDGTLWAWGSNSHGQLGDNSLGRDIPLQIVPNSIFNAVSAGCDHTVAIKNDGTLWAWGWNAYGQLGDGSTVNRPSPVQIAPGSTFSSVAAGVDHTMAIRSDGTLWVWGNNTTGQLGDGTTVSKTTPVQIMPGSTFAFIAASKYYYGHAIKTDGTLWGWGFNLNGQLGDGTTVSKTSPVQIAVGSLFKAVSAGYYHSAAIKVDDTLWTWGANGYGGLGDGTVDNKLSPILIAADNTFNAVAAGEGYTVAIRSDGTLWAWGWNLSGQIGDGSMTSKNVPQSIVGEDYYRVNANIVSGGIPGISESFIPNPLQYVRRHGTTSFTMNPSAGFSTGAVSGCNGTLVGNIYTTGIITEPCTVSATFAVIPPASAVTLIPSLASPQITGTSISFNAQASGGSGNYEYKFWLKSGGVWSTMQEYSTTHTWTWTTMNLPTGTYTIQVQTRNVGSKASYEANKNITYVLRFQPVTSVSVTTDPLGAQAQGRMVTVTATQTGSPGPVEYFFQYRDSALVWHTGQAYSTSNIWNWDTTGLLLDTYTIQVWARTVGNTANYDVYKNATLTISAAPSVPIVTGITPTTNAQPVWAWTSGGGGNGTYRYQLDNGNWNTTTALSYQSTTTLTDGQHTLFVQERNSVGIWSTSGYKTMEIDATGPTINLSTLTTNATTTNPVLNIVGTAADIGGMQGLTIMSSGSTTVVNVSPDGFNTAILLVPGSNQVTFTASDALGNQTVDTLNITYDSFAPLLTITTPADNSTTRDSIVTVTGGISPGATVTYAVNGNITQTALTSGQTWTATATLVPGINTIEIESKDTGGRTHRNKRTIHYDPTGVTLGISQPNEDAIVIVNSTTIKGIVANAPTGTTITIDFEGQIYQPILTNGEFSQVLTVATDKTSIVNATAYDSSGTALSTVQRTIVWKILSITANPSSPQTLGVQPTFTANGIGGSGNYEYKFWLKTAGVWNPVQDYSTTNTWTWNTTGAAAGTYGVQVYVRNVGSSAKYEATKTMSYTLNPSPATGATLISNKPSPQIAGNSVTFTAGGVGGSGNYEYKFWIKAAGIWTAVQGYSTTTTFTWDTTGLPPGTYRVQVYVRNVGSTAKYEAVLGMGYVIQ